MEQEKPYVAPFIRRLMPDATEAQILEASENLRAYLAIAFRAFLRKKQMEEDLDSPVTRGRDRFSEGGNPPSI